ncbi:MAG TPA: helix-turn-helix domain-containing protein, partial [Devosiaceae bacterium]|nr:helix-turn-helix domain-containing protein [Devosiaceae bacterium]
MTPLGARLRAMRAERGIRLKDMAEALNVSSAYLSAL